MVSPIEISVWTLYVPESAPSSQQQQWGAKTAQKRGFGWAAEQRFEGAQSRQLVFQLSASL